MKKYIILIVLMCSLCFGGSYYVSYVGGCDRIDSAAGYALTSATKTVTKTDAFLYQDACATGHIEITTTGAGGHAVTGVYEIAGWVDKDNITLTTDPTDGTDETNVTLTFGHDGTSLSYQEGTLSGPWQTIDEAIDEVDADHDTEANTVYVYDGSYNEGVSGSGTYWYIANSPTYQITVQAINEGEVTVNSKTHANAIYFDGADNLTFDGIKFVHSTSNQPYIMNFAKACNDIRFLNCTFDDSGRTANYDKGHIYIANLDASTTPYRRMLFYNCTFNHYASGVDLRLAFTSGSDEFERGDTVTGLTGGATATVSSTYVTSGTWGGGDAAGYINIYNQTGTFEAEAISNDGVVDDGEILADSYTLGGTPTCCTVFISESLDDSSVAPSDVRARIEGIYFIDCYAILYGDDSGFIKAKQNIHGLMMDNCTLYQLGTSSHNFVHLGEDGGYNADICAGPIIQNCDIRTTTTSHGVIYGAGCFGGGFYSNYLHGSNSDYLLVIKSSFGSTIHNNSVVGGTSATFISRASFNARITNNVFYNGGEYAAWLDDNPGSTYGADGEFGVFTHNILYPIDAVAHCKALKIDDTDIANWYVDYNCYYGSAAGDYYPYNMDATDKTWSEGATWWASYGTETGRTTNDDNSYATDPRFVDVSSNDFSTKVRALINAGIGLVDPDNRPKSNSLYQ